MTESPGSEEIVTYHANIATANVFPDQVIIEFRSFLRSHKEVFDTLGPGKPIPAPDATTLYKSPPIARVVLTFSAAKGLMEYLQKTVPVVEAQRKA